MTVADSPLPRTLPSSTGKLARSINQPAAPPITTTAASIGTIAINQRGKRLVFILSAMPIMARSPVALLFAQPL